MKEFAILLVIELIIAEEFLFLPNHDWGLGLAGLGA